MTEGKRRLPKRNVPGMNNSSRYGPTGDALYSTRASGNLSQLWKPAKSAVCAVVVMTAIELFQLTMIPAHMLASEHWVTRICARLMGVEFSFLDLLAYGVGIACIYLVDCLQLMRTRHKI